MTYGAALNCMYAHLREVNYAHLQFANRRLERFFESLSVKQEKEALNKKLALVRIS